MDLVLVVGNECDAACASWNAVCEKSENTGADCWEGAAVPCACNSDTAEDQNLKLAVRDAVGSRMAELLSDVPDREACEQVVEAHLPEIAETAQAVVREAGYEYEVHAAIEETEFPSKTYGKFTFPAGKYEALRVVIGEGEGHNWWCVMYPNMCFEGSMYEVVDESAGEELKRVLSKEEYRAVLEEGNYKVRCRYLTFLDDLKE